LSTFRSDVRSEFYVEFNEADYITKLVIIYLRQGGYVLPLSIYLSICLSVCLSVSKITQKIDEF